MRKAVLALLLISRFFAICAVVAGVAVGLLMATFVASFTCFDICPSLHDYFARLVPGTAEAMIPCLALEGLALVTFAVYCLATSQARRAARQVAILLVGGLISVVALDLLLQLWQAVLPVTQYGLVAESPAVD
ncbi:MAG TPA: hypothetical protein VE338_13270 [Ktedonobacterales bacterium]|jgi:hypothetical protein|nr:hypothetical protein [Ktedonobacterales bacterium]